MGPEGLIFEYRLEPGPATTRNAITLLQLNGAPDELVERALGRAAILDEARRVQSFLVARAAPTSAYKRPRPMRRFSDLPIRRKLFVIGWITSLSALSLMMVIFIVSAYFISLRNLRIGLGVQAGIVAGNLSAAAVSSDPITADRTLRSLNGSETFDLACAYTSEPILLAQYVRLPGRLACPAVPPADGATVTFTGASIVSPLPIEGPRVGTLYIRGNLKRALEQLLLQLLGALFGFGVALLSATLIAGRLHRQIPDPLTALSRTSAQIAREGDYSVRARKQGNDEIGALVDAFNDMVSGIERRDAELRTASDQKDEFLAVLSHELRTPLNAIVGWLQILRLQPREPEVVERALASLDRNARAQTRLIEDMLDVSRIIAGKLELRTSVVDLRAIVEASSEVIRPDADAKGLTLEVLVDASLPCLVWGDADRLQQAVLNLLSNAVKFTLPGGRVELRLSTSGPDHLIAVHDTGIGHRAGFPAARLRSIPPGRQLGDAAHGGLGLGLAIVRDLVALHGGEVRAASGGEGQGATFTMVLPRMLETPAAVRRAARGLAASRLDGLTVLIADDDLDARQLAGRRCRRQGRETELVAGGVDALAALGRRQFDVFVCDVAMPDLDGYAVLRRIRENGLVGGRFLPVVAVTAHAGSAEEARAQSAGYQGFVVKPYEFSTLTETVATAAATKE